MGWIGQGVCCSARQPQHKWSLTAREHLHGHLLQQPTLRLDYLLLFHSTSVNNDRLVKLNETISSRATPQMSETSLTKLRKMVSLFQLNIYWNLSWHLGKGASRPMIILQFSRQEALEICLCRLGPWALPLSSAFNCERREEKAGGHCLYNSSAFSWKGRKNSQFLQSRSPSTTTALSDLTWNVYKMTSFVYTVGILEGEIWWLVNDVRQHTSDSMNTASDRETDPRYP